MSVEHPKFAVYKSCDIQPVTGDGTQVRSQSVIITTGTFLRGQINIGLETTAAGRVGDAASVGLAATLDRLNFQLGRLKTGTPPRLDANTINYSVCTVQPGDKPPVPFSFINDSVWIKVSAYLNMNANCPINKSSWLYLFL